MYLTEVTKTNKILQHTIYTRKSSGDELANVNFFYGDTFNHFYAVRPGSYRIRGNNAN